MIRFFLFSRSGATAQSKAATVISLRRCAAA